MNQFTLVIPTRNRPERLERQLQYYADGHFPFPVVIADSSDPHFDPLKVRFRQIARWYDFDPDIPIQTKLSLVLGYIDSECVAIGADDDFFYREGLEQAVAFMQTHSEYSLCGGHVVSFTARESNRVRLLPYWPYTQQHRDIESPDPITRMLRYSEHPFSVWYYVQRRVSLRDSLDAIGGLRIDRLVEWIPALRALRLGKVKTLNQFYMAKERGGWRHEHPPLGGDDYESFRRVVGLDTERFGTILRNLEKQIQPRQPLTMMEQLRTWVGRQLPFLADQTAHGGPEEFKEMERYI